MDGAKSVSGLWPIRSPTSTISACTRSNQLRLRYNSLKFTSMVAATVTGCPSFIPGLNFQSLMASTALSSSPRPRPCTTWIWCARPSGPIST